MCSLHHIKGTESDSILNSSMLCHEHHTYGDGHNVSDKTFQAFLLNYTIRLVLKSGYEFQERDLLFYIENKKLYDLIA